MKKIKKIISIGSLSSLLLMPLVAASCKKNGNDEKVQIINNDSNLQTSKQMTPPNSINDNDDKSDKNEKTDNNQNSESPINPNETDDEKEKKKIEEEKQKKLEEEKKKIEEEKKLKEKQEQEDKNNVEVIKAIVKNQEDAFATFHTRKDFLDQINVFAKEKGIENLELADGNQEKTFKAGKNDPKNNVKLRLGAHEFEVQLGNVLKDRVATKYYIEDNEKDIFTNKDGKFPNLKDNNQNVVITQIGYSLKEKYSGKSEKVIKIDEMPKNTKAVPKHLPLKIKSLECAFKDLKLKEVLNLDRWDVSNVESMYGMFYNAKEFNQDISKWNTENVKNMLSLFTGAEKFNQPLNSWNVSNVIQMSQMFFDAKNFNQDLDKWNVSNVIDMENMFQGAESFNGKIDNWNVNNVKKLSEMFLYASKFSWNLSKWKIKKDVIEKISHTIFEYNYKHKNEVLKAWQENN